MRTLASLFLIFMAWAGMASAATDPARCGLAMHDRPHYACDFAHLETVNPNAPKGGELSQAAIGTFDTLNPFTLKGTAAQGLALVHDRLMERNWEEPFTLYPLIAQRVVVPADRSSITFYLDPRARFSDGSLITADDVLFSFETLRDHGRPNMRRVYQLVSTAARIDDRTIRFNLGPGHDRETVLILAMMPVLSKKFWQDRDFNTGIMHPYVASGPYRIKHVDPGRRIVYERIPDHWAKDLPIRRGMHNVDHVRYDYFRDDTVAFEAFRAGTLTLRRELDLTRWMRDYTFPSLTNGTIIKDRVPHGRPERVNGLVFNLRRPPFDQISVREALAHAFDFSWVNRSFLYGQANRIQGFFPNTALGSTGGPVIPNQFDRASHTKVNALLQQAGWAVRDGRRVHTETGKPFRFEILLSTREDEKMALVYREGLARLGIAVDLRTIDSASFRSRMNNFDFDMAITFWNTSLSPGSEQILYWGCASAGQAGGLNYTGVCDARIDQLAKALPQTQTREDLVQKTQALDTLLQDQFLMIPFSYVGADLYAYDRRLQRPDRIPLYGTALESWWMDTSPRP